MKSIIKLDKQEYEKVKQLIKSQNELSVFSVINGIMPGKVYVNRSHHPTVALIRTSECNLIAGSTSDKSFNDSVSSVLDFWDPITSDSIEWIREIPLIHKNKFVKQYKRRHYMLSIDDFIECDKELPDEYVLEKVNPYLLRNRNLENLDSLLEWVGNWENDEMFMQHGAGYFIHNNKMIVSWSLSDCSANDNIAIGIQTDERYRNRGFGKKVVSATIKHCFSRGYKSIEWLCVDSNKGSIAIAEKLGFKYKNEYYCFSSYPPIENLTDLSESEWYEWGEYLESASLEESSLIWECLYCYIKANDIEKTISIMTTMQNQGIALDYLAFSKFILSLKNYGMGSNFKKRTWTAFINEKIEPKMI